MTKINRYNGNLKAFGADAPGQERVVFGNQDSPPVQSDTLNDNINANFFRGWGVLALGNKPPREWFNGLTFTATQLLAYLHQMGVAEWNTTQEYYAGSVTTHNGVLWILPGNVASSIGEEPGVAGTWLSVNGNNVKGLKGVASSAQIDGLAVTAVGFYANSLKGGQTWVWDSTANKTTHDAVNVLDPDRVDAWDGTDSDLTTLFTAAGSGTGCFIAVPKHWTTVSMAGGTWQGLKHLMGFANRILSDVDTLLPDSVATSTLDNLKIDLSDTFIDCTSLGTGPTIEIEGSLGSAISLTTNAVEGQNDIDVPNGGAFSIGDWVKVRSDAVFDASDTSTRIGEFNRVREINSNTLTLYQPLRGTYNTADNAVVEIVDFIKTPEVIGGRFQGNPTQNNAQSVVNFRLCLAPKASGLYFERFDLTGISVNGCLGGVITQNVANRVETSATGYAFNVGEGSDGALVTENQIYNCRHSFTITSTSLVAGITRNIVFSRNYCWFAEATLGVSGGDCIDTHPAAEGIVIENNQVIGGSGQGINIECKSAVIKNNIIQNVASQGIGMHNETDFNADYICQGNTVFNSGGNGIEIVPAKRGSTAITERFVISDNLVDTCTGRGIVVSLAVEGLIGTNIVKDAGLESLRLEGSDRTVVTGGRYQNVAGNGVRLVGPGDDVILTGLLVRSNGGATGIFVDDSFNGVLIDGCNVKGFSTTQIRLGSGAGNLAGDNIIA